MSTKAIPAELWVDSVRITASIKVNTNTIGMEFWMTPDISEKTPRSVLTRKEFGVNTKTITE